MTSKSKDATEEQPKTKKPNNFAAALGAAINQVAETATEMRTSSGSRRGHDNRKKRPCDNVSAPAPGSSGARGRHPTEDSIVVDVVDLQDLVVQSAERVARRIVGETASSFSLATKTAVSMMTEYAAAGTFINDNTQIRFPSVSRVLFHPFT